MKFIKFFPITISFLLSFSSCKGNSPREEVEKGDSTCIECSDLSERENITDLKSEEMIFLVEGAVDSWFFYHLHDYRSYEPIIRSTDYDADENFYMHKCRYRASTLGGGYETEEKIFKVFLQVDSTGLKDFHVEDITGHKSITEKEG